jgi:hypothetical protein
VLAVALAGCGKDIQLDRSSLQELYGTDHRHADCIADRLEDRYSDDEIEQIDEEVRDIENHEKTADEASELFHRFDDDLHTAANECGIRTGPDEDPTTTTPAGGSTPASGSSESTLSRDTTTGTTSA